MMIDIFMGALIAFLLLWMLEPLKPLFATRHTHHNYRKKK